MKPLFGVAVFGLLPVPPCPLATLGPAAPDDRPTAAGGLKQFRLEAHTIHNEQDASAPDPVECDEVFTPERRRG